MDCIESKFEILPCGCKFLVRPDDPDNNVLCVEFGKDCRDPDHNPAYSR